MTEKPIFRMSEAGECPKALVAERLHYESSPAPAWLEKAAREGRRHEHWVKEDLREEGYSIEECSLCPICKERYGVEREGIHVELEYDNFLLIGHLDGKFYRNGSGGGLEIKSMSQYEFDRWMKEGFSGFSSYACQLALYMEADPKDGEWLYIVKNRSSGYQDRKTITELPAEPLDIFSRIQTVISCMQQKKLPEIDYNTSSIQCQRCRFKTMCIPAIKELSPVEEADLYSAATQWRTGNAMEKDGKRLADEAKAKFEKHTLATGLERWRFDELFISFIHVKGGRSYPIKKLLENFTEEQLLPASEIKLPYNYIKVKDLRREEIEDSNAEMPE